MPLFSMIVIVASGVNLCSPFLFLGIKKVNP
nr:MAG TPA: hypothetical protein [Caudoviricetes sp.]